MKNIEEDISDTYAEIMTYLNTYNYIDNSDILATVSTPEIKHYGNEVLRKMKLIKNGLINFDGEYKNIL